MSDPTDAPNDQPEGKEEPAPYVRLPWYVVAAALIVVLGAALVVGLYFSRTSRQEPVAAPPQIDRTPPTTTAELPAAVLPTPLLLVPGTSTPAAVTSKPGTASVTAVPTPRPETTATPDPRLVAEVTAAFENYWNIRIQALLDLDETHLAEVMGGDHLRVIAQRIEELRSQNRAVRTDVDHDIHVLDVSTNGAHVVDDYISNSVYVDAATREPLSEPASDELRVLYRLEKSDGTWKVVDSVQAD
jgi:hypothetical protein